MFLPQVRDRLSFGPSSARAQARLTLILTLSASLGYPARLSLAQAAPEAAPATAGPSAETPVGAPLPLSESLHGMARADYAAARILYEDEDYAGAYTKLMAAYEASRDPRLLWNMAACEKAQRHYASVIELLERYSREGEALIGADERQATAELLERVREFVNELRLDVQPEGTVVIVDGVRVATLPLTRPLRLDMGKRKLRFEKPGYVAHETEMELSGGKSADLKVRLEAEVHQGTLRIVSEPAAVINVDGHPVGTGLWTGNVSSGPHAVAISAAGKQTYTTEVVVKDHDTSSLHINLVDEAPVQTRDSSNNALWWIVGGVALAGAGVGGYFLLRPDEDPSQPESGTFGFFEL